MTDSTEPKKPRGLAALSPERRREIARMGGSASTGNFKNDRKRAAALGKKGGLKAAINKRKYEDL